MPGRKKLPVSRRDLVMFLVLALLCAGLACLDLFPKSDPQPGRKVRARVVAVDNTDVEEFGLLKKGSQLLEVEILGGRWKGQRFRAANILRAQMELDKLFEAGDTVLVGILDDVDPETYTLNAQDHYRIGYTVILFSLFAVLLAVFGRFTGICALLSFVFSCLVIWKLVIPLCLLGWYTLRTDMLSRE